MNSKAIQKNIKVKVLFFAALKDLVKKEQVEVDVVDGSTIDDLKKIFFSEDDIKLKSTLFAINHSYVTSDTVLSDGDEVAFLPIASGG